MRVSVLLVAMFSVCAPAVMAQSPEPRVGLSAAQREHLKGEIMTPVLHTGDLPPSVRDGLRVLFNERTFEMAEPDAEFQVTDVVLKRGLPFRRLIIAACSADHCLVHYEKGGIAHVYNVAWFALRNETAAFEWGGLLRHRESDLAVLREQILAGAVNDRISFW
jgi:hypothetical protein